MKQFIFFMLVLCGIQSMAQTDEFKGFIEFVPTFSNLVKDMPYEYMLKNNRESNLNYPISTKADPLKQSFFQIGLTYKIYLPLKNNWVLSIVQGATYNEYKGSASYQIYYPEKGTYSDKLTDTEEIFGYTAEFKLGLSKRYYFDSKKKIMFLPEFLCGIDAVGHQGEIYDNLHRAMVDYGMWEATKVRVGGQLDLKFNYRITNSIGVGLTFEQIAQVFYAFSKDELAIGTKNEEQGFDVSIGKLSMPELSFICYFNKKKASEVNK